MSSAAANSVAALSSTVCSHSTVNAIVSLYVPCSDVPDQPLHAFASHPHHAADPITVPGRGPIAIIGTSVRKHGEVSEQHAMVAIAGAFEVPAQRMERHDRERLP